VVVRARGDPGRARGDAAGPAGDARREPTGQEIARATQRRCQPARDPADAVAHQHQRGDAGTEREGQGDDDAHHEQRAEALHRGHAQGLDRSSEREDIADSQRPIWVLESGPQGGTTSYVNTWAKGELPAGQTARFEWDVTVVEAGTHELTYRVAAGLDGRAMAVGEGGGPPSGKVTVAVTDRPAQARVDPETGEVILEGGGSPDDLGAPIDPSEESRGGE
jgi:hypothetical protein